jgi:hypothetical protein
VLRPGEEALVRSVHHKFLNQIQQKPEILGFDKESISFFFSFISYLLSYFVKYFA